MTAQEFWSGWWWPAMTAVLGFVFTVLIAVAWGAAHLWVSAMLRRHRPVGRLLMLGLAGVDLLVLPFGTALGAYAFWVLLTHGGDRLFTVGRKG